MNRSGERWLVIGAHDPFPGKNGSALRIRQHLETLKKQGAETFYWGIAEKSSHNPFVSTVHELPMWANLSPARKLLQAPRLLVGALLGHDPNVSYLYRRRWLRDLDFKILSFKPTHVLVCETWMARYVSSLKVSGYGWFQIADLHNVETNLRASQGSYIGLLRHFLIENSERWLCSASDFVWVCSEVDKESVRSLFGVKAQVVPNKVPFHFYQEVQHTKKLTFGMVGIWSYEPNGQAADILLKDIWPKAGDLTTPVLVGKNPTVTMIEAKKKGAQVTGEVADVRPHLDGIRTIVVPLLAGGGTRMKVLEALAAGVPVVATRKAVEGLDVKHLEHCVICEPAEMPEWILKLWTDKELEEKLRKNGRDLVRENYSW